MSFIRRFIESQAHKHLIVNWAIVAGVGLFNPTIAVLAALAASFGKELYDKYYGTGWSWIDLVGDLIGMILGLITLGVVCR